MIDTANGERNPYSPYLIPWRSIGLSFLNDSVVDVKYPLMTYADSLMSPFEGHYRYGRFTGTQLPYKIAGSHLLFYKTPMPKWGMSAIKILRRGYDSLFLEDKQGRRVAFTKYKYDLSDEPAFDQIALSTSGCMGSCPSMNIIINSNGEVAFYGVMYINKLGYFKGQIPLETFLKIEREFRKASIEKLEDGYSGEWTCDEDITTTFLNDHKIVKAIRDYGETGPDELVWSYPYLRYLHDEIELTQLTKDDIPFYLDRHFGGFEFNEKFARLNQSTAFVLWNYLRGGKLVMDDFDAEYEVSSSASMTWGYNYKEQGVLYKRSEIDKVERVLSDGRYYKFEIEGQSPIIIDIGFNFVQDNKLEFEEL